MNKLLATILVVFALATPASALAYGSLTNIVLGSNAAYLGYSANRNSAPRAYNSFCYCSPYNYSGFGYNGYNTGFNAYPSYGYGNPYSYGYSYPSYVFSRVMYPISTGFYPFYGYPYMYNPYAYGSNINLSYRGPVTRNYYNSALNSVVTANSYNSLPYVNSAIPGYDSAPYINSTSGYDSTPYVNYSGYDSASFVTPTTGGYDSSPYVSGSGFDSTPYTN